MKHISMKNLIALIMAAAMILSAAFTVYAGDTAQDNAPQETAGESSGESSGESEGGSRGEHGGGPGGQGGSGGMSMENDEEVQAALEEASDIFMQDVYVDEETGIELAYSLYIPEGYQEGESYPLIMFIPDSTGSGLSPEEIVSRYYGAAVWATEEEQEKHPSFVFVPAFSETVVDDNWNTSDQIETAVKAIQYLTETYSIDTDRLYTTGQSMGCMTSLYLNSRYPDLFAASLFVSGQWDINVLQGLTEETFFYITSAGDSKASAGQAEVMALFDEDQTAYSFGTWNCKDEDQNEKAEALIAEGLPANMILFEAEYTDDEGSQQTLTHMSSFNYAYKIEAVRDWLFAQTRQ